MSNTKLDIDLDKISNIVIDSENKNNTNQTNGIIPIDIKDTQSFITTTTFTKRKQNAKNIQANLFKIFFDYNTKDKIINFLDQTSQQRLKQVINKRYNIKEKRKIIKEKIKNYILDFGKHNDIVKFRLTEDRRLVLTTSIFNINPFLLKSLTKVVYNEENIELEKEEFYQFLKLLTKPYFFLSYNTIKLKVCKSLIPFEMDKNDELSTVEEEDDYSKSKYEKLYEDNGKMDFSKESLIERQRQFLEEVNAKKKVEEFYPLLFISGISHWAIILCQGGYFSCGFFLKDKLIEHKSDHKYVIRKKAGQRQIVKDSKKTNKNSIGAQLRREGEKKHQENIELILNLNNELLARSSVIYLYAPGLNKSILIGSNDKPMFTHRNKVIGIPFSISRANFTNMMDVYHRVTSVVLEEKNFLVC